MLSGAEKALQFFQFDSLRDGSYIPLNGSHVRQIGNTKKRFFCSFGAAAET